jgi:L-iditol 2-dehydrogenase
MADMQALVLVEPRKLEIRTVARPEPKDGEILIRVKACTVCNTTDLEVYRGVRKWGEYPALWGHEITGVVESIGRGVTEFGPGDRILSRIVGTGYAQYAVAKESMVIHLPDSVGFPEGAIAQLMPIAVRGIEKSVRPGDSVAVIGVGPAGLLCVQTAKAYGADTVIAVDRLQVRLDKARELGADHGVLVGDGDPVEQIRGRYPDGVDVSVECTGIEPGFRTCEGATRNGGTIAIFGTHLKPITLDLLDWEGKSFTMLIMRDTPPETKDLLRKTVGLLESGNVKLGPILSHVWGWERAEEAFDMLENHPADCLKIAMVPPG